MRKILIVGAGQAGLMLALSLQDASYDVTVMSAQTPENLRNGRVMSTQYMFGPALALERERGLDLWKDRAPQAVGQRMTLADPPGQVALSFIGMWERYAQSVDQRIKMADWLELFEERGGNVIYHPVTTSDLEGLTALYELTLIAAGKGELVELFDRDAARSPFTVPQRMLSCIYLHGVSPRPDFPDTHVRINVSPGVGELFMMPGLTRTGPCTILLWEAVPGGPYDRWADRPSSPAEHLDRTLQLLREYLPWEHERTIGAEPTDGRCVLYGGYTPVVRHPIGRLSDTALVLGMGDVVVTNDPVSGQGANNAAHCAAVYEHAILQHGDRPFDAAWMQGTFGAYWDYARHATDYTNMTLGELPEHVQQILGAAAQHQQVADRFAAGTAYPPSFADWLTDPDKTATYLATIK
ncbi:MAG: styrene monooxygenase/indole monooxygenase family protein [Actinoallomurus sp.]